MTQSLVPHDKDAEAIGWLYAESRKNIVQSVHMAHQAGGRLIEKKSELAHGEWLPWLEANRAVLGFDVRAAQRLIQLANTSPATHLTAAEALQISRKLWGHDNHLTIGTGENEWYTPQEYIEAARAVLGRIDLDPATSRAAQERIKAGTFFTVDDDGLSQEWRGRVWLNPPYSTDIIGQFIVKLVSEYSAGKVTSAILLTHNYTDTQWFHAAEKAARLLCFTEGRIRFEDTQGDRASPTQGQTFFYFGDDPDVFAGTFSQFGFIR